MYWVSSVNQFNLSGSGSNVCLNTTFGVTDTSDGVETTGFTKNELLSIVRDDGVSVDGVDIIDNIISLVRLPEDTVRMFKQREMHRAISTMSTRGIWFGLRFKYTRASAQTRFPSTNKIINIRRVGVNRFEVDEGTMKSHVGNLTIDGILGILEYYANWSLADVASNRL